MTRRRKMLKKRRRKQREADVKGVKLVFAEGYAAVKGQWVQGDEGPQPLPPNEQP